MVAHDRIQLVLGKCVRWEVPYDNMAEIRLARGRYRPFVLVEEQFIGIRLRAPELFDATWPRLARMRTRTRKRCGFDLPVAILLMQEPAERCLDVLLTCLHRYRAQGGNEFLLHRSLADGYYILAEERNGAG